MVPFGDSEALKRWEEGTWALEPADDAVEQPEPPRPPPQRGRARTARPVSDSRRGSKRDKPGG
ncbi:WD-40 repeat protein [Cystobacter fuscus DSM 2262]|uniref:WD-40 repeat protein n=1 Tax=Cystobacter fuscus (strain ATCC 25194 / DSM 2262 / NBRC 100088 / M29) TaxID=1242864 RepID=S9QJ43_CYSF2|nr:WD-40 repeat protein [Cystobacter fuscus DSM 2262]